MENILKKIAEFDKVNETKLAKHEVELGSIQDVFNKIESINSESKKSFDIVMKAKALLADAKNYENGIIKQYQSVYVELTKLSKTVKDLGLPTAEIDDKLKLVKGYISNNEAILKNLNQATQIL